MEIFVDGGLFEIFIALGLASAMNTIVQKKYLLVVYTALVITSAVSVMFVKGELFWIFSIVNLISVVMLALLLWKHHLVNKGKKLFDLKGISNKSVGNK